MHNWDMIDCIERKYIVLFITNLSAYIFIKRMLSTTSKKEHIAEFVGPLTLPNIAEIYSFV